MRNHRAPLALILAAVALSGCESNDATPSPDTTKPAPKPAPTTTTAPTATTPTTTKPAPTTTTITTTPTTTTTTTATPAPPATLLGKLATAERIKVRRPLGAGEEAMVEGPADVAAMRKAIGMDQEPTDGCPRCIPSVQLVFEDGSKTRLGSVGLFCDASAASEEAVLRDALAESCQSLKLADPEALKTLVDRALPMTSNP